MKRQEEARKKDEQRGKGGKLGKLCDKLKKKSTKKNIKKEEKMAQKETAEKRKQSEEGDKKEVPVPEKVTKEGHKGIKASDKEPVISYPLAQGQETRTPKLVYDQLSSLPLPFFSPSLYGGIVSYNFIFFISLSDSVPLHNHL